MEKKKRVLQVVSIFTSLPCFFGDQFRFFSHKDYEVHFICSPSPLAAKYAEQQQSQYYPIALNRSFSILDDIKALFIMMRYIRKHRFDVVVGHTPKAALISMMAALLTGVKKRVYFRHGLIFETSKGFKKFVLKNFERITAFCATKIICVSPSVCQRSIEEKLNAVHKQTVLGNGTCNGIDTEVKFNPIMLDTDKLQSIKNQYGISDDNFVVGFSGRLVKDKGIDYLVKALDYLVEYPNIILLLVGRFEDRDALSDEISNKIKTDKRIIFTGEIDFQEISYYYELMDVLVLPSFREGFPTSVLEASSMEKPILTTKVTGCIDAIIEGETGFYIEHDAENIAAMILKLYKDQSLRERLGKNGRAWTTSNYDHSMLWDVIEEEVYQY
jgi:glycosyltransferase involved in cell wall biosynthesis